MKKPPSEIHRTAFGTVQAFRAENDRLFTQTQGSLGSQEQDRANPHLDHLSKENK
jgi:hypothetical protein